MRECWINVSNVWLGGGKQEAILGTKWAARSKAVATEYLSDYRLHVRLKPERLIGFRSGTWREWRRGEDAERGEPIQYEDVCLLLRHSSGAWTPAHEAVRRDFMRRYANAAEMP